MIRLNVRGRFLSASKMTNVCSLDKSTDNVYGYAGMGTGNVPGPVGGATQVSRSGVDRVVENISPHLFTVPR